MGPTEVTGFASGHAGDQGARAMLAASVSVTRKPGFRRAGHSVMPLALSQPDLRDIHIACHRFAAGLSSSCRAETQDRDIRLALAAFGDPVLERHRTMGHVTTLASLKLSAVRQLIGRYDRVVTRAHRVIRHGYARDGASAMSAATSTRVS